MGIQERDYYIEHVRKQQGYVECADFRRPLAGSAGSPPDRPVDVVVDEVVPRRSPPDLIGADWHWSLKLLVWLAISVLVLVFLRLVGVR